LALKLLFNKSDSLIRKYR